MPAVRNACVARGATQTSGAITVYTVPAANVFLLKSVMLFNISGASLNVNIELLASDGSAQLYPVNQALAANTFVSWSGWTAMNEGDHLVISASGAGLHFWAAGAVLPYNPAL